MPTPAKAMTVMSSERRVHRSKDYKKLREALETRVNSDNVAPPAFLPKGLIPEFERIAYEQMRKSLFDNTDCDVLAMYLIERKEYIRLNGKYNAMKTKLDAEPDEVQRLFAMREKALDTVMKLSSKLGLDVSARCRLSMPKEDSKPKNKFAKFTDGADGTDGDAGG